jgi:hypothetical protein
MNAIFISQIDCYLKLNGKFIGDLSLNSKIIYNFNEDCFLEFIPISDDYLPTFYFKNHIGKVKKYTLNGDLIFIPTFEKKRNLKYEVLIQKRVNTQIGQILITCVQDGCYKYFLDGAIVYSGELSIKPTGADAKIVNGTLLVFFYGEPNLIFIFSLQNGKLIFQDYANKLELGDTLNLTKEFKTIIPTSILYKWKIEENVSLLGKETFLKKSVYDICDELLDLSFLQLLTIGANVTSFTTPHLNDRIKDLIEFIGKPYMLFLYYKNPTKIVGIYKDYISLYSLSKENNLIDNIVDEA